ncbi:MAG TPA: hemerythrin domain-containing protein [Phycisphaerae bacterium]|jgi:hemerythrin-like domain-containing protein|nr:hemerythrin domain-containing protein [Phycisphaerae bacterium]HPM23189.1 hemerythrin domain-containing protein [Phycisphaerae bacterium]
MSSNLDDQLGLRLQEEHKALLQLSQVLKEHIAAMPSMHSAQWLDGLRAAFDRLQAHIERCIAMKEKDGYLGVILKERPTLARQVESIQSEHGQLLRMGEAIRNDLAATRPEDHVLVGDACARVQRFMAIVAQHEQRENMIVMFAFNQDLGGH